MATPVVKNLRIKTNGTYQAIWRITSNGVAVNLTGYSFEMSIRATKGLNGQLITNATVTIDDAVDGKIKIEIAPLPSIRSETNAFYDLLAKTGGKGFVWIEGKIKLDPGASYQEDD